MEFEKETKEIKQDLKKSIGIDLGLIDLYYDSNGKNVSGRKFLRKKEKELARLQRKKARFKTRSKEYNKTLLAIQKAHFRIKSKRNDFLHKDVNKIIDKNDLIIHENLNIKGMIRRPKPKKEENSEKYLPNGACWKAGLNKSMSDTGWAKFLEIIKYKAEINNKVVTAISPKYTSQICSNCGEKVKKSLSTRTHKCTVCGFVANRDHNAAINILRLRLQSHGLSPKEALTISAV